MGMPASFPTPSTTSRWTASCTLMKTASHPQFSSDPGDPAAAPTVTKKSSMSVPPSASAPACVSLALHACSIFTSSALHHTLRGQQRLSGLNGKEEHTCKCVGRLALLCCPHASYRCHGRGGQSCKAEAAACQDQAIQEQTSAACQHGCS